MPALPKGTAFRAYVEASGTLEQAGSIRSGVAITNTADTSNTVTLEVTRLDGSRALAPETLTLPPSGQVARFLDDIFSLPDNFSGVLRVTSASEIAMVALRLRVNENGELKMTTTSPSNEMDPSTSEDRFFAQLADSVGWSTQFILFSGTAGQNSFGTLSFIDTAGEPWNLPTKNSVSDGLPPGGGSPVTDRAALVALYEATAGPGWANAFNWLTDVPLGGWYGVTTDGEGRVWRLDLSRNDLKGRIPSALGNLVKLDYLGLRENDISGPIPSGLGNLVELRHLDLSNNLLSGPIPSELGGLAKLTRLRLHGGRGGLSGQIPRELGNLANLRELDLSNNGLVGPIPPEILDLANLRVLYLYSNNLSGPIPSKLGGLQALERLLLHSNKLTGFIPASFVELPLRFFRFDNNDGLCAPGTAAFTEWFEGIATRDEDPLCNESDRAVLGSLYENAGGSGWSNSEGWLSDDFLGAWRGIRVDSLGRVTAIDLSQNGLAGVLPSSLGELVRLTELGIGGNSALSGRLPSGLTDLPPFRVLRYDGTDLCTPAEPYFQAWLKMTVSHNGTGVECGPISERDVLVALYEATAGRGWANAFNWLTDAPLGDWYGVTTDGEGRVTGLDLSANNLTGLVPAGLRDLGHLTYLDLSANNLTGAVPRGLGRFTQLEVLRLNFNDMSGALPPELGGLANLKTLNLNGNLDLSASIPPEFGNLANLENLFFGGCGLTGSIPPELGRLTKLRALRLNTTPVSGVIPPELGNLASLEILDLSNTYLTGTVPPELGNLASLKFLDLSEAGLTGSTPPELGNLANLERLDLSSNDLTGAIPPELGMLARLEFLAVGGNRLSGRVAPEFGNLSRLRELILANNGLAGVLPASLTNLRSLETFQAGGTGLCAPSDTGFSEWLERVSNRRVALCESASRMAYLVQAVQSPKFPVPLVAGKEALLRVFVTAARANSERIPRVRASFYVDGSLAHVADIPGKTGPIPTAVDEGSLAKSANAVIPAEVVQPGLEMVVDIDPDGMLDAGLGVARRIPESGRAAVDVRAMPVFDLTVIPLLDVQSPDSSIVATVEAMAADPGNHELLWATRTLLPVGALNVTAHEPVLIESTPGYYNFREWRSIAKAIRVMEGGAGHYMTLYPNRVGGGLADTGGRTSFAAADPETIAHELGHNMSLKHAPCGSSGVDEAYPYQDGAIGAWGYDFSAARLIDPAYYSDLMTYCDPAWVSDYNFDKALRFRLADEGEPEAAVRGTSAKSFLLWGGIDAEGVPYLEPAFVVDTPPTLPDSTGEYEITGRATSGAELFSMSFSMSFSIPETDAGDGGSSFAFALPVRPGWEGSLATITLSGPGGSFALDRDTDLPMAILLDPSIGQVRGILRELPPPRPPAAALAPQAGPDRLDVLFSRGMPDAEAWGP